MATSTDNSSDHIFYYLRNNLTNHVRNLTNKEIQTLKGSGNTDVLFFWKAMTLIYQGDLDGSIKLLRKVQKKKSMELPASIGLIFAFKRQKTIDKEAIVELEEFSKSALTRADLAALVAGARACMLTGNLTLGRQIAKRAGARPDGVLASQSLSGWLEMYRSSGPDLEAANAFFTKSLEGRDASQKTLDAMLGHLEYLKRKGQYAKALDVADEIIILFEWFKPRFTIKAQLLVLTSEWDLALETANRAIAHNKKDVEALQVIILYHLVNSGNYTEMEPSLRSLEALLVKLEPKNGALYLNITRCLGSLCGREEGVLRSCYRLMQAAAEQYEGTPDAAVYYAECGKLALKLTEFAAAGKFFTTASQADDSNPDVLLGMVESQVFQGKLVEALQQMEFLEAVADAANPKPVMVFLNALIVWRKRHNMDKQLQLLAKVVDLHLQNLKNCGHAKNSVEWFVALDLDFLLQICQEYMQHCGTSPIMKSEAPPVACVQAEDILGRLVELVPGNLAAKCLLARCKFLVNDFESARFIIEKVIKCDNNYSQAQVRERVAWWCVLVVPSSCRLFLL
jgi:tetratricopeptide (TPR) repeat protein